LYILIFNNCLSISSEELSLIVYRCDRRALSKFNELDFKETESHLNSIEYLSLGDASTGDEVDFGTGPLTAVSWDGRDVVDVAQQCFIRAITLFHTGPSNNHLLV